MKHEDIWRALDTLAAENGLSASGLAKRSGLDPTTFNPSKRRMPDGRARWPSTESLAKVLSATGASLEAFTTLVTGARALTAAALPRNVARRIPLIGLAQAGGEGFSTTEDIRSAEGGTRLACRRSQTRTPTRLKSAANQWSLCFATGTS